MFLTTKFLKSSEFKTNHGKILKFLWLTLYTF